MADIRYNISQLFQFAFGINMPIYITEPLLSNAPANINYMGIDTLPEYYNEESKQSWMGTPIMFQASFKKGSYKRYKLNGELEIVQLNDFALPPATMFSFRRAKNITRTNVLGSNGTVKEIFGFDDWIIDVRGLCLDEPDLSAQDQFAKLLEWENLADAIEVSGSQFGLRGIQRVCISEWSENIPQGQPGVVAFQMSLIGDDPMEFGLPNYVEQ